MLGLGTLVVRGGPALQRFDDLVFEIPNQELSHDAINDIIPSPAAQFGPLWVLEGKTEAHALPAARRLLLRA